MQPRQLTCADLLCGPCYIDFVERYINVYLWSLLVLCILAYVCMFHTYNSAKELTCKKCGTVVVVVWYSGGCWTSWVEFLWMSKVFSRQGNRTWLKAYTFSVLSPEVPMVRKVFELWRKSAKFLCVSKLPGFHAWYLSMPGIFQCQDHVGDCKFAPRSCPNIGWGNFFGHFTFEKCPSDNDC